MSSWSKLNEVNGYKNLKLQHPQRLKDQVLFGLSFVTCYTNDVIIFSITIQDYVMYLQVVFKNYDNGDYACIIKSVNSFMNGYYNWITQLSQEVLAYNKQI